MRKLTCDPKIEIIGVNLTAYTDNLQKEDIMPIMEKHGLTNIDPNAWYPALSFLNVLNDLAATPGMTSNFVAIGMKIGELSPFPPEITTLGQALEAWDASYQWLHRGGDVGKITAEKVGENSYKTIHKHLYPDDFNYGIAYGFAKRFLPPGTHFKVFYDPNEETMDEGGERTIINITWQ